MSPGIFRILLQSIRYYRRPVLYQVLIIALLSAVITGSLLTGGSVRASLRKTASSHLGNTGILISSGIRYFDASLAQRVRDSLGINCSGLIDVNGYCQSMNSQKAAFNTHIYGVGKDFFAFNGSETPGIKAGEIAINDHLAEYLGLKPGDEIILKFKSISDIPADAPFAPSEDAGKSVVLKVGTIIHSSDIGNFSLSISQIVPMNIFMNLTDIGEQVKSPKINRLLIDRKTKYSLSDLSQAFKNILLPSDIGLKIREIKKTRQAELISDRIFIDDIIIKQIKNILPSAAPVITYLGNDFKYGSRSTPYSFISALPPTIYPDISSGNEMIINKWMADDLGAQKGDSVIISWYSPDSLNKLKEKSRMFAISQVVDMKGIWSDSLLMPEFPGISGRESCSDWDAGVQIRMNEIRTKDEAYWNKYRGTPKAFISYDMGVKLWGNNYGPATAVRFPEGVSVQEIEDKLKGSFDPQQTGFTFTDIYNDSIKAADESVDFGTLFLSLGFFLLVASVVLLTFVVSSYFDSKRQQISTLSAIGFNGKWIRKLLFLESFFITLIGCLSGAFAGYLVNIIITGALNSVWRGAVQTDTMDSLFSLVPVLTGFSITFLTVMVIIQIKVNRYLKTLKRIEKEKLKQSANWNLILLIISSVLTILLFSLSLLSKSSELALSFATGALLLITLLLVWRYIITDYHVDSTSLRSRTGLSRIYYSFNVSNAVTPVLFIAAGIFAVFITTANRKNLDEKQNARSGGTGGYLLWIENTVPVKDDLNSVPGRKTFALDADSLSALSFVQMKKSPGNDASCLNLNHVTAPPLLGIDPSNFISKRAFSFTNVLNAKNISNPWLYLNVPSENNVIYGIADQTVLDWGLKMKIGDTIKLRSEKGLPLNIIIAAGLQSSVFQGYILTGIENFKRYYPSVSGSSVMLADGKPENAELYKRNLEDRLSPNGVYIEPATSRLASFYQVNNTYLSIFGVFGALGMITGIAGLGFVLLRNYNQRKREFGLLMATGFAVKSIRRMILNEQVVILSTGVTIGVISAIVATLPSIKGSNSIPWLFLTLMVVAIMITGLSALYISVRSISSRSLTEVLKKE